jgi:hypothetical protein
MNERWLRTLLVIVLTPGLIALIAMIVVMRPLTTYADGFHGPEEMWRDILRWARTGVLDFHSWAHATRGHLRHRRPSW